LIRLHPDRYAYYANAIDVLLDSDTPKAAIWPLWHTWTYAICALPPSAPQQIVWQATGEQLGLAGDAFSNKVKGLDAYLDQVDELLEDWAVENGG